MSRPVVRHYFAYGSNMNRERVRQRAMPFVAAIPARLEGYTLVFDKVAREQGDAAHANITPCQGAWVEGVLYELVDPASILVMDRFERTPVNYSREVVQVHASRSAVRAESGLEVTQPLFAWTYFANPAVRRTDRLPGRQYLQHLLAGEPFLSADYLKRLRAQAVTDD